MIHVTRDTRDADLLLAVQECERKEKVGSTQRPVRGAMLAAFVM